MGAPSQFGHLVNFAAALRKPALIPFGTFNVADTAWLAVITDMPSSAPSSTTVTLATIPFSTNLVINAGAAQVQTVFLTGNVNSCVLDGSPQIGQQLVLRIIQVAPGGWIFTLPSNLVHDAGFAVEPGAGLVTVLPLLFTGTQWIFNPGPAFSAPQP